MFLMLILSELNCRVIHLLGPSRHLLFDIAMECTICIVYCWNVWICTSCYNCHGFTIIKPFPYDSPPGHGSCPLLATTSACRSGRNDHLLERNIALTGNLEELAKGLKTEALERDRLLSWHSSRLMGHLCLDMEVS